MFFALLVRTLKPYVMFVEDFQLDFSMPHFVLRACRRAKQIAEVRPNVSQDAHKRTQTGDQCFLVSVGS